MSRKRRDYNYANYCLEQWAVWSTEHNGYPARSPILKFGEANAYRSESSIPTGVEPFNRDVERANLILAMMNDVCNKSAERAHLLKVCFISRKEGELIKDLIARLDSEINERHYYDALEEFTMRLETLIYSKKVS